MSPSCLIIIDVQNGFINPSTAHIPKIVSALQNNFDHVFASRFINQASSPFRQFLDLGERFAPQSQDIELAFNMAAQTQVFDKFAYSALTANFRQTLIDYDIKTINLCGIATDNCVLKTAVDLFEAGLRPQVLTQACASHAGQAYHQAALMILERLIGKDQMI